MRGTSAGLAASKEYSHGCRAGTLMHALAAPLRELGRSPASPSSSGAAAPFEGLLRAHFARKAAAMRATCAAWEAEAVKATASPAAKGIPAAASAVRAALDGLPKQPADAAEAAGVAPMQPATPPSAAGAARARR